MIYDFIFTLIMMIIDAIISIVFKNDYSLLNAIFIPCLASCSIVLSIKEMSYRKALEFATICGLFISLFEPSNIWVYPICYVIIAIIVKIWSINTSDSLTEQIVLCVLSIFLKEVIVYIFAKFYNYTTIGIITWIYKVLFKTIIYNVPLIIIAIFFSKIKNEVVNNLLEKKIKKEKVFWGDIDL